MLTEQDKIDYEYQRMEMEEGDEAGACLVCGEGVDGEGHCEKGCDIES